MKLKLISLILSGVLLTAQAQTTKPTDSSSDPKAGICGAVLVIGCLAIGTTFIVWAMNKTDGRNCCVGPCTLILEEDSYNNLWNSIATNHIDAVCHTNKFEVFCKVMDTSNHRYRVKIIKE